MWAVGRWVAGAGACLIVLGCVAVDRSRKPNTKIDLDGHELAAPTLDTVAFRAYAERVRAEVGPRGVERLVALRPDDARALAATGASDDVTAEVVRVYAAGIGTRHAEAVAMVEALERNEMGAGVSRDECWARALSAGFSVADPGLCRRVIELAPPAGGWPAAVPDEASAWDALAGWEIARGESEAALIDFSRAESLAIGDSLRLRARLGRARASHLLGRNGEALALLGPVAAETQSATGRSALALAGAIAGALDQPDRARDLLRRSLDGAEDWPGAGRALSDLAVAEALSGDEKAALPLFDRAEARLKAERDDAGLVRALRNHAHVLRRQKAASEAEDVDRRAVQIVRECGVLPDPMRSS